MSDDKIKIINLGALRELDEDFDLADYIGAAPINREDAIRLMQEQDISLVSVGNRKIISKFGMGGGLRYHFPDTPNLTGSAPTRVTKNTVSYIEYSAVTASLTPGHFPSFYACFAPSGGTQETKGGTFFYSGSSANCRLEITMTNGSNVDEQDFEFNVQGFAPSGSVPDVGFLQENVSELRLGLILPLTGGSDINILRDYSIGTHFKARFRSAGALRPIKGFWAQQEHAIAVTGSSDGVGIPVHGVGNNIGAYIAESQVSGSSAGEYRGGTKQQLQTIEAQRIYLKNQIPGWSAYSEGAQFNLTGTVKEPILLIGANADTGDNTMVNIFDGVSTGWHPLSRSLMMPLSTKFINSDPEQRFPTGSVARGLYKFRIYAKPVRGADPFVNEGNPIDITSYNCRLQTTSSSWFETELHFPQGYNQYQWSEPIYAFLSARTHQDDYRHRLQIFVGINEINSTTHQQLPSLEIADIAPIEEVTDHIVVGGTDLTASAGS